MEKKEIIKLGILYAVIFFLAVFMDMDSGSLEKNSIIYREGLEGESIDVELLLDIENVFTDYLVHLEVEPMQITKDEAETLFLKVSEEIEAAFQNIEQIVPQKESYEEGLVEANWSFSPSGVISSTGEIDAEEIPEDGLLMEANVQLSCGAYEKIISFPFRLEKPVLSTEEKVLEALWGWIEQEQEKEGEEQFLLPTELEGFSLQWKEKKEYLSFKILFLEVVSLVLLLFAKRKEKEAQEKKLRQQRELLYPEILNQLLILLEAGMTTRQAWHRIAYQYMEKRKRSLMEESEVYEAILLLDRRLSEGGKETAAYDSFAAQMDVVCYRRLARLLVNNLEKGNKDICQQLSIEAKQAYDQRLLLAKKLGEEASTKMLVPMMLMMVLVMVIIMAPAMMNFGF